MSVDRIREAVRQYQQMLATNIMEDGRPRWEYYGVQRRIAQAACNYNGYIITGTRHDCPIMRMQVTSIGRDVLAEWMGGERRIEGFTDQYGNFLTRKEAYVVAQAAKQIIRDDPTPGTLYSECYI